MAENQLSVSDVKIKQIMLWRPGTPKIDLTPHFGELNLYESVFHNSMTANLTLVEAVNLPEKFPILGEELIIIDFTVTGMPDGHDLNMNPLYMYVHELTNHKLLGPQGVAYSLKLVSEQYMNNIHTRVSKSYSDKKTYQIAREIYFDYLNPQVRSHTSGLFQPTDRIEPCVIPNWTPYKAIDWLARRSNSLKNPKAANYVFYESLYGSSFVSLDILMQRESVCLFSLEPAFEDPGKVEHMKAGSVQCDYIHILHEVETLRDINNGCYASKLITHDIVTKKILQHDYDLLESWDDTTHLSKFPPVNFIPLPLNKKLNNTFAPAPTGKSLKLKGNRLSDCTDSAVMFAPKHNQMFSKKPNHIYNNQVEDWKLQRKSQLALIHGMKFEIQAGAMPWLRVGMCADIHMMSPEAHREHGTDRDNKLSGKCLITAIRHVISQQGGSQEYKTQLELNKDGVERDNV